MEKEPRTSGLINFIDHDFTYNRSLINRKTKLVYDADTSVNSKASLSLNSMYPSSFAATLRPMSKDDYSNEAFQNLQSFPVIAT